MNQIITARHHKEDNIMLDQSYFAYNQDAPLAVAILSERTQNNATIQNITYASPKGGKVSGYLIFASKQPPVAGLIFGHWGQGNRDEFANEAILLTRLGFVSLCLDAPYRRPAAYEPQLEEPPQAEVQWIVDVRRGVDLLQEQFSLAPEQLGYIGHSYSATFAGPIARFEHRIKAYVLMAGFYAISEVMRTSTKPVIADERNAAPAEEFNAYLEAIAPLDASHYIGRAAPASLFFQFAHTDDFVSEEDGQRYFDLASEPKKIAWYDNCNHELNAPARLDRVNWLCATFGLPQPSQEVLDLLEKVPSPQPLKD
jgi:fermentation-respiration switch protein FrsA (DUF1100 family)